MVVQHILAVRKGTREVSTINKDDKNSPIESEDEVKNENEEIKLENEELQKEIKADVKKTDEILSEENKPEEKSDEKLDDKSDKESDTTKTEQLESEQIDKTEENKGDNEEDFKKTIEIDEYYVKYRNFSYLHCEWKTEEELTKGDKRIAAKLKRFKQKMANNTNIFENVS